MVSFDFKMLSMLTQYSRLCCFAYRLRGDSLHSVYNDKIIQVDSQRKLKRNHVAGSTPNTGPNARNIHNIQTKQRFHHKCVSVGFDILIIIVCRLYPSNKQFFVLEILHFLWLDLEL